MFTGLATSGVLTGVAASVPLVTAVGLARTGSFVAALGGLRPGGSFAAADDLTTGGSFPEAAVVFAASVSSAEPLAGFNADVPFTGFVVCASLSGSALVCTGLAVRVLFSLSTALPVAIAVLVSLVGLASTVAFAVRLVRPSI